MKALLTTPRVIAWFKSGRPARVLHLFDEVVNIVNDRGDVISLSTIAVGPGPFSLIMDDKFPAAVSQMNLTQRIEIDRKNQTVSIGDLQIKTEQIPIWSPRPTWEQLQQAQIGTFPVQQDLIPELTTPFSRLLEAYEAEDFTCGRRAIEAMAGLGSGLTPSGDDVLMGAVYALWVWTPDSPWIKHIIDCAAPRTTTLSAAYLHAAGRGEATIHWHNLVSGQPDAVTEILSIGHTSGSDAWIGFTTMINTIQHPI